MREKQSRKVIVAGHICLDITPVFPEGRTTSVEELIRPGKLIRMNGVEVSTGGAVANTGLAMKFFGADVTLMGKVGKDAFGSMVLESLARHGAETGLLVSDGEATSYSVVLAMPGVDRVFLHDPGANDTFCADDIPERALAETALLHFGYPPLMRAMYERDGAETVRLMRRAKACGAATSLDLAAVDPDSEAGHADWAKILERVLPHVDFFVPSAEELCFMLDRGRFADWRKRAAGRDIAGILDIEQDVKPLADRCMALGAKVLLIKCGVQGIYYRTADREKMRGVGPGAGIDVLRWADLEGFEKSYVPKRVLSATGAGDTSIAAFLTAVLEGYEPETAVRLAAAAGASCVEAYDALGGLKPFGELFRRIDAGWEKQSIFFS